MYVCVCVCVCVCDVRIMDDTLEVAVWYVCDM